MEADDEATTRERIAATLEEYVADEAERRWIEPALLALLDSGWEEMVLVILVYSVLNVTIQTFIQPRIVGNSVGLSAEITFMSLVVWTYLLGALGALLAVPMTLLLRAIFIDSDERASWVAPLIDAQVAEEKPVVVDRPPDD